MAMLLAAPRLRASGFWLRDRNVSINSGLTSRMRKSRNIRNVRSIAPMALIVALIAGLAYWDAARESTAALDQLAERQVTLARGLAALLRPAGDAELSALLRAVERPNVLAVLVHRAGESALLATDGSRVSSALVLGALDRGAVSVKIPRDEAAAFRLPARTALAGIAHVDRVGGAPWDLVAIASAAHERDREIWARRRLILSVLLAAGLVLMFGGLAMRNQRKELILERELALAALAQGRDQRLQRASKAAVMGTLAVGVAHEIST